MNDVKNPQRSSDSAQDEPLGFFKSPYQWDYFSDQPYPIKDKKYKRKIRIKALPANIKLLLVNGIFFPLTLLKFFMLPRFKSKVLNTPKIGLCVNLDKEPVLSPSLVSELGVRHLSLRIPLSDIANINAYASFASTFQGVDWLFVILQDRNHIDNKTFCEKSFHTVFSELSPLGKDFQIGNAINRTKWGFSSVDEYLSFFKVAQTVRDQNFSGINLFGSSVIDFEIYALLRSLWHFFSIKYDGVASLLYVDRRGAPENKQFIFDLVSKINFFWAAISLSPKTKNRLLITEANWPIEHTKPFAPALGDVWVSEVDYAKYLIRFYLLAIVSGRVECIYWHQLIAPGYGLIDNRNGAMVKRRAYFIFQTMCEFLNDAEIVDVFEGQNDFEVVAKSPNKGTFHIAWSKSESSQKTVPKNMLVYDAVGARLSSIDGSIKLVGEPVYFYQSA